MSETAANPDSTPVVATTSEPQKAGQTQRLMSVDALRGFDMFWIVGAGSIVAALDRMTDNSVVSAVAKQLTHVEWAGFVFYDLIFPLFVFIVGVSAVFSLTKEIERDGRPAALKRLTRRAGLLFVIGIFYAGGFKNEWPDIRLLGVLQRIALAYFGAGLLFCFLKPRGLVIACASLLVGYWALMTFAPIRDIQLEDSSIHVLYELTGEEDPATLYAQTTQRTSGKFEPGYNVANHFDFNYLPGKKWDKYWDPEGILSTFPAIATCLLGVFAGLLIRKKEVPEMRKVQWLFAAGVGGVVLGSLWGLQFPVVKKIWTSSFVLVAGGWSAILLGAFYLIVDVWKFRSWCQPFVWVGMNSITIYLVNNIIGYPGFRKLAERFVGGDVRNFINEHVMKGLGELFIAAVGLGLAVLLAWYLNKRKIYLRL